MIICIVTALAMALALPQVAHPASGALDATFGTGGKVTTDFSGDDDSVRGGAAATRTGRLWPLLPLAVPEPLMLGIAATWPEIAGGSKPATVGREVIQAILIQTRRGSDPSSIH